MLIPLDIIVESPPYTKSINMKDGLLTFHGMVDIALTITQTVAHEKVPKQKTYKDDVRADMLDSFLGSYGLNFEITADKEADKALKPLGEKFQEKKEYAGYSQLENTYRQLDKMYGVFDVLRAFSVIVNLIKEQLSNENGFNENDRVFYYEKLINLTEFAHLRLICTAFQFQNKTGAGQKLQDKEFQQVCQKLKLRLNNYYKLEIDNQ